jgi:hypothetical protein
MRKTMMRSREKRKVRKIRKKEKDTVPEQSTKPGTKEHDGVRKGPAPPIGRKGTRHRHPHSLTATPVALSCSGRHSFISGSDDSPFIFSICRSSGHHAPVYARLILCSVR